MRLRKYLPKYINGGGDLNSLLQGMNGSNSGNNNQLQLFNSLVDQGINSTNKQVYNVNGTTRDVENLETGISDAAINSGNPYAMAAGAAIKAEQLGSNLIAGDDKYGVAKSRDRDIASMFANPLVGTSRLISGDTYNKRLSEERQQFNNQQQQIEQNKAKSYTNAIATGSTPTGNNMATRYKDGGKIHIKSENKGKFTDYKERTGKTTEEALHSSNAHVRQMANFARNAKKWKHADGGNINQDNINYNVQNEYDNQLNKQLSGTENATKFKVNLPANVWNNGLNTEEAIKQYQSVIGYNPDQYKDVFPRAERERQMTMAHDKALNDFNNQPFQQRMEMFSQRTKTPINFNQTPDTNVKNTSYNEKVNNMSNLISNRSEFKEIGGEVKSQTKSQGLFRKQYADMLMAKGGHIPDDVAKVPVFGVQPDKLMQYNFKFEWPEHTEHAFQAVQPATVTFSDFKDYYKSLQPSTPLDIPATSQSSNLGKKMYKEDGGDIKLQTKSQGLFRKQYADMLMKNGGNIENTKGGKLVPNGKLLEAVGQKHEEGGILLKKNNTPVAEIEDGETMDKGKNFVFSDHLKFPNSDFTFADMSKQYKNDPQKLNMLAELQEKQKGSQYDTKFFEMGGDVKSQIKKEGLFRKQYADMLMKNGGKLKKMDGGGNPPYTDSFQKTGDIFGQGPVYDAPSNRTYNANDLIGNYFNKQISPKSLLPIPTDNLKRNLPTALPVNATQPTTTNGSSALGKIDYGKALGMASQYLPNLTQSQFTNQNAAERPANKALIPNLSLKGVDYSATKNNVLGQIQAYNQGIDKSVGQSSTASALKAEGLAQQLKALSDVNQEQTNRNAMISNEQTTKNNEIAMRNNEINQNNADRNLSFDSTIRQDKQNNIVNIADKIGQTMKDNLATNGDRNTNALEFAKYSPQVQAQILKLHPDLAKQLFPDYMLNTPKRKMGGKLSSYKR
jgi:hypothetical protein